MILRRLFPILALCLLMACRPDFDELNDTQQRWVEFTFDPSEYFSEVLVSDGQGYELGASNELEPDFKLRIVGYCYDSDQVLVDKSSVFGDMRHELSMKFKHLTKDTPYHFLFLADIVQFYSDTDYYEIWFQLMTHNLGDFYMVSFKREKAPANNVLLRSLIDVTPSNQTITVSPTPIAYNGYFVLTNSEGLQAKDVSIGYSDSFYIHNMERKAWADHAYPITDGGSGTSIFSFIAPSSDEVVKINITKSINGLNVTRSLTVQNPEHRPFVATIDYDTFKITKLDLY